MTDKYFLNTCSGRQCFLIANQIAHSSMSDWDQLHCVTTQLDVMMKNVLVNQDIMNTYPKYCKSNLKGYGKNQNNSRFLMRHEF